MSYHQAAQKGLNMTKKDGYPRFFSYTTITWYNKAAHQGPCTPAAHQAAKSVVRTAY